MLNVSRRSAAVVVLFGSLVARGDGCSGDAPPGDPGVAQCSGDAAIIGLVPGYCAAIPNCLDGLPYYDMTFSLEPQSAVPDWLEFRTTRGELADADPSLPVDAFRVCATRMAMPDEAATVTLDVLARQPSRSREITQKATVLVRATLPSVVITPRADRSQFFAETTTGAVGRLVAADSAEIVFDVVTNRSEANGCEDLDWALVSPTGSVANITCDTSRPNVAVLRLDPAPGGRSYELSLVVKEPSGLRSRSNVFRINTVADDGQGLIVFTSSPLVAPYGIRDISFECREGLFGPSSGRCRDLRCMANAAVILIPDTDRYATEADPVSAGRCAVNLSGGQAVTLRVRGSFDGVMTESFLDLRAQ